MRLGSIPGVSQGVGDGRLVEGGAPSLRCQHGVHINRYVPEHTGPAQQVARQDAAHLSLTDAQRISDHLLSQGGPPNAKPEFRALALDALSCRDLHAKQMYKNMAYDVKNAAEHSWRHAARCGASDPTTMSSPRPRGPSQDAGPWEYFDRSTLPVYVRRRKQIGRRWVAGEAVVDALARHFGTAISAWIVGQVEDDLSWLSGGVPVPSTWRLCLLENQAAYLVPVGTATYRLCRPDRHFDELVSADGAGLCATSLCVNRYGHHLADEGCLFSPKLVALERGLASFRELHPEGRAIRAVLD